MKVSATNLNLPGAQVGPVGPDQGKVMSSAEKKLLEVAKLYEGQFLNEMMKAMRATVHESEFVKVNQAEKIFREQLDQESVDKWAERGGLGLQDVIYEQLVEKFGAQLGIPPKGQGSPERPQGQVIMDATAATYHVKARK